MLPLVSIVIGEVRGDQGSNTPQADDRSAGRPTRPARYPVLLALLLTGLAGAADLVLTCRAPLVTSDSASYLSAAENLVSDKGLTTAFNDSTSAYHPVQVIGFHAQVPFAHFGPLYPLALAAFEATGLSGLGSARLVGLLALIAIVPLLFALAVRALDGCLPLVVACVLIAVVGPSGPGFVSGNLLELSGTVLSEPLFYATLLGTLLSCSIYMEMRLNRYLAAAILLGTCATLTRYVGVSLALACGVALLSSSRLPYRQRMLAGLGMVAGGLIALLGWPLVDAWLSGGSAPRQLAFHLHPGVLGQLLATTEMWFFPSGGPTWFIAPATIGLLAIAAIVPLTGHHLGLVRSGPPDLSPNGRSLLRLLALFTLSYLVVVVGSSICLDASLSLDQRVLGPIQVTTYLVLISLLYWSLRSCLHSLPRRRQIWAVRAAALLLILPIVPAAVSQLRHPFLSPQPTAAMIALSRLPADEVVVTNEPSGVFVYAHRGSVLTPVSDYVTTGEPNPDFETDLSYVGRLLRQQPGVVAFFPEPFQPSLVTVAQLEQSDGLTVTRRFADGTLFLSVKD